MAGGELVHGANVERQHGTVFAEAAAALLVPALGKAKAHELLATLSARAVREATDLHTLLRADPATRDLDPATLAAAFDVDAAEPFAEHRLATVLRHKLLGRRP